MIGILQIIKKNEEIILFVTQLLLAVKIRRNI